jgi:hypothetical protein
MKPFKFFQKPYKVQDSWMDNMDDNILGRIVPTNSGMVEPTDIMRESINSILELSNYINDNFGSGIVTNSEVSGNIE